MPEFKSYSTRNFKTDHIKRLKLLKSKLKISSVENVLIKVVEAGLLIMENPLKEIKVHKSKNALIQTTFDKVLKQSAERATFEAYKDSKRKRIAPFGIIEENYNDGN